MGGVLARFKRRGADEGDATTDQIAEADPAEQETVHVDDAIAVDSAGAEDSVTGPVETAEKLSVRFKRKLQFGAHLRMGAWLGRPMTSFHLIVSVAALLVTLGLIMVLSASGVHSYDEDGSPWTIFSRQLMWTGIGLFAFWVALRIPVSFLRRSAFSMFAFTIFLLVLVLIPGIGKEANGTRGWFVIGGLSMQPSEMAKIAFAIWGAHLLATRRMEHASLREMLIPLIPAAVIALALIVAQPDLGQTVSLGIILLALLWYAGLPLKVFLSSLLAAMSAAAVLAISEGYRSDRVRSWLDPSADAQGSGYQARQAKFALANGGVFGDGLGQGMAKWNYLPNAHNDFIFAIIGEELGFIGAFGLLVLFGLFAYTGTRIARRSADPFLRLLTATATMWVVGQVFINVGYVIGLLPVTGIQLPLISAGGTSTVTTLFMIGLVASAARHEPESVAALRAGGVDRVNRLLRLPLPETYSPSKIDAMRDRLRTKTGSSRQGKSVELASASASTGRGSSRSTTSRSSTPRSSTPRSGVGAVSSRTDSSRTASSRTATARSSRASASARRSSRAIEETRQRAALPAKDRTAERAGRRAGHHGDASTRGYVSDDNRSRRQSSGSARRTGTLEGQRYG